MLPGLSRGSTGRRSFRFVHFSDIHIQPELGAPRGVSMAVKKVLELNPRPEFIITGGDHVMDLLQVSDARAETQFELYREAMKPLEMPISHVVGNHDCFGWSSRSPITLTDAEYGKRMWEEKLNEQQTYRSFDVHGVHFILLDTIAPTADRGWTALVDDAQLSWLKDDLSRTSQSTPIIVVTHVPVFSICGQFSEGTHHDPGSNLLYNGKDLFDLWKHHQVKAVLQGHTHVVEEITYRGTSYVTGGAVCGDWWKGYRFGVHPEGFMVYDVGGDWLKWNYVSYGWRAEGA
jgi:Icc protein